MTKTKLNNNQITLINKVVSDEQKGLINHKEYWKQYTSDEMNFLQAVFYAVRNWKDLGETVDDDLDEDIKMLSIGINRVWGIVDLPTDYVADILQEGLEFFQ